MKGSIERELRMASIGERPVYLRIDVPRVQCHVCGTIRQIDLKIADANRRYTRAFERTVISFKKYTNIKGLAEIFDIGWDTVKDILKRWLYKKVNNPKLKDLKHLAIDEICIGKGHRYFTLVMDLESGQIVYVGDGKGGEALEPFWRKLKRSGAQIRAISIDMSKAYIKSVTDNCPKAAIVFDHFHLVKHFTDMTVEHRRELYNTLPDSEQKKVLKGTRFILMKRLADIEPGEELEQLEKALALNKSLHAAFYMTDDLAQIWSQPDKATAEGILDSMIKSAISSDMPILNKMGKSLNRFRYGILNWFDHRINSGKMEGTNNKIKTMMRQSFGFRDIEFFRLCIKGIHLLRYALVG